MRRLRVLTLDQASARYEFLPELTGFWAFDPRPYVGMHWECAHCSRRQTFYPEQRVGNLRIPSDRFTLRPMLRCQCGELSICRIVGGFIAASFGQLKFVTEAGIGLPSE